ncbi:MAG: NAD(P)/FAD-dependent oxidoreductase [Candidatus Saccharibacteria bacterium]|nr:NAD(P)/FAD-dependent oxidoreductase [Moraxellaceae bacterium]
MKQKVIIIGAGHATAQLSVSLRQQGWADDVLVVSDEPHLPYHRPPLSKTFLSQEKTIDDLIIRPSAFYQKNQIQFQHGRVVSINRAQKNIQLSDGLILDYDKLALCTGSRVRKISIAGCELEGVHYLRHIADVIGIQPYVQRDKRVVIIGGGYIGLEAAAMLKKLGMHVVVLEMAERILQRVTAPEVSEFYMRIHTEEGVVIHSGKSVTAFVGNTHVQQVVCSDGSEFPADLVIVGVGVLPNVELAVDAGLEVNNGIVVDRFCRTSDENILAAGDCTNHFNQIYNRRIRLESVPNATEQGKTAAAAICGLSHEQNNLPWFWSDQYDLKLQIAGLSEGYDHVVMRGDAHTSRSCAIFYFKEAHLIAADCINRPQEFMLSKRLIAEKRKVHPSRLMDESISVKELLLD